MTVQPDISTKIVVSIDDHIKKITEDTKISLKQKKYCLNALGLTLKNLVNLEKGAMEGEAGLKFRTLKKTAKRVYNSLYLSESTFDMLLDPKLVGMVETETAFVLKDAPSHEVQEMIHDHAFPAVYEALKKVVDRLEEQERLEEQRYSTQREAKTAYSHARQPATRVQPPRAAAAYGGGYSGYGSSGGYSGFGKGAYTYTPPRHVPKPFTTVETFALGGSASLKIAKGSVCDFKPPEATESTPKPVGAIVNAANEGCLGGGGVDMAINTAGGKNLERDRAALPLFAKGVRCPEGYAVVTGPGDYGTLSVNHVVHAVGPIYPSKFKFKSNTSSSLFDSWYGSSPKKEESEEEAAEVDYAEPDALLRGAYQQALERCRETGITDVAFSLLSAGIFRGERSLEEVLTIGVHAIRDWIAQQDDEAAAPTTVAASTEGGEGQEIVPSPPASRVRSVTLCGFNENEVAALKSVCRLVFADGGTEPPPEVAKEESSSKKIKLSDSDNAQSEDAQSNEDKPDETKPDDAKPDETKPNDAKPDDTQADDTKKDDGKPPPLSTGFEARPKGEASFAEAEKLKDVAIIHFKKEEFKDAAHKFEAAGMLAVDNGISGNDIPENQRSLYIKCYTNAAVSYFKMEDWKETIRVSSLVLDIDEERDSNRKALYFRGVAHMNLGSLKEAKEDIVAAFNIDQKDKVVRKAHMKLSMLFKAKAEAKKKEKASFSFY